MFNICFKLNFVGLENAMLITIAPELDGALDAIKDCVQQNIIVSVGHTTAELPEVGIIKINLTCI